ncbi:HMA2 domain-containing protein [Azospirillum sp. ST 5-10]|uniref:HMA2 domain-containing protein n=1 Tax=unclassified Azospirillum TaxID=2630922 RepID=UPI003F4A7CC0
MSGRTSPIAAAIPGRIRVRHPRLRQAERNRELASRLDGADGLRVAERNPATGSLLLLYDPAYLVPSQAEARVAAAAAAVLDAEGTAPPRPGGAVRRRSRRRDLNRASKIAMLASLAVALGALGTSKRLHAAAGAFFLALLAVHTAIHRRRLLH